MKLSKIIKILEEIKENQVDIEDFVPEYGAWNTSLKESQIIESKGLVEITSS